MPAETLLVEIGTEELPPKPLNAMRLAFGEAFAAGLAAAGLAFDDVHPYATPRRLALLVAGLADRQTAQQVELRGPKVSAAYDSQGAPTQALLGFAQSCGVKDPARLETLKTSKGEWLVFRDEKPGAALAELLPGLVTDALAKLPVERTMRWGKGREEFVRPVHWLCVLHGAKTLPVRLFGLTAGGTSQGHRFMAPGAFKLARADAYVEECRKRKVLVDFDERRARIVAGLAEAAAACKGQVEEDESLLDEVAGLVEWPVALLGGFDKRFLDLPREALTTAMKSHQRCFPLVDGKGRLLPHFIAVANIESKDPKVVVAGNERVIHPRLADASFFYAQDTRQRLADRVASLDQVVFQAKLGSYGDKTRRLLALTQFIAEALGMDGRAACRAAELCKADLVTDMVGEFPELQGVMGGHYARADGEDDAVATAIAEQYLPIQAGGGLPACEAGACLALADKLDTLVGLFGIGKPPSGSGDPFGLRRLASGVVRICVEKGLALDINDCLGEAAALHRFGKAEREKIVQAVHGYLCERLVHLLGEEGIAADNVEAARASRAGITDFAQAGVLARILADFRQKPEAAQVIAANKRVANLLRKEGANDFFEVQVDANLLEAGAEEQLHGDWGAALVQITAQSDRSKLKLEEAEQSVNGDLKKLAALQPVIDSFFDEVLVMAEDPRVRANRIALLSRVRGLFLEVADFSLLH